MNLSKLAYFQNMESWICLTDEANSPIAVTTVPLLDFALQQGYLILNQKSLEGQNLRINLIPQQLYQMKKKDAVCEIFSSSSRLEDKIVVVEGIPDDQVLLTVHYTIVIKIQEWIPHDLTNDK